MDECSPNLTSRLKTQAIVIPIPITAIHSVLLHSDLRKDNLHMTGYSVPNHIMSYLYKKYEEIQRFKCFGFKTEDFSNNTQFLRLRPYQRKYVLKEMAIRYESFKLEKAKAIFEILASYFI